MLNDRLQSQLKELRLSGLARTLEVRCQEARGNNLAHVEFLELVFQDEVLVRHERLIGRRVKAAQFRELKTLDSFNWSFNPSIHRKQIYDLATCRFVRELRDVLFLGPPGVGKSFLVQALGYEAIKQGFVVLYRSIFDVVRDFLQDEAFAGQDKVLARYLRPDLLIIDDMGMKQLPKHSGEYLFEIIMRRYETRSTIMTSNRPLEDWGKLVGDVPSATAILDRFLHHAELISITGRSYRLQRSADEARRPGDEPAAAPVATAQTAATVAASDTPTSETVAVKPSPAEEAGNREPAATPGVDPKPATAPAGSRRPIRRNNPQSRNDPTLSAAVVDCQP
jgi:DNA replication protein DnaC